MVELPAYGLATGLCQNAAFVAAQEQAPQARLLLEGPGLMVTAANALWKEDSPPPLRVYSPWPGSESPLKSRFCHFGQLSK